MQENTSCESIAHAHGEVSFKWPTTDSRMLQHRSFLNETALNDRG